MHDKLREYVEMLFKGAPAAKQITEIKEEIIQNTIDRYDDLVRAGKTPESAFHIAVSGIGDVSELIGSVCGGTTGREEFQRPPASADFKHNSCNTPQRHPIRRHAGCVYDVSHDCRRNRDPHRARKNKSAGGTRAARQSRRRSIPHAVAGNAAAKKASKKNRGGAVVRHDRTVFTFELLLREMVYYLGYFPRGSRSGKYRAGLL